MAKNNYFKDYINGGMGGSQATYYKAPMSIAPTMSTPLGPGTYDPNTGKTYVQAGTDQKDYEKITYDWDTGATSSQSYNPVQKVSSGSDPKKDFGAGEIYNQYGNYSKSEAAKSLGVTKAELEAQAKAKGFNSTQAYYESLASGTGQVQSSSNVSNPSQSYYDILTQGIGSDLPSSSLSGIDSMLNSGSANFMTTMNNLFGPQKVYAGTTQYGMTPFDASTSPYASASYVPQQKPAVLGTGSVSQPLTITSGANAPTQTQVAPTQQSVQEPKSTQQPNQTVAPQQTPMPTQTYQPNISEDTVLNTLNNDFASSILGNLPPELQSIAGLGEMEDYGRNIIDQISSDEKTNVDIQNQLRDNSISQLELAYDKLLAEIPFMTKELQMEAQDALDQIADALDMARDEGTKAKRSVENLYGDATKSTVRQSKAEEQRLRNLFSSLGTAESSAFIESMANLSQDTGQNIYELGKEKAYQLSDIDKYLAETGTWADRENYKVQQNLTLAIDQIKNDKMMSEREKALAMKDVNLQALNQIAEIQNTASQSKLNVPLQLAQLQTNALSSVAPYYLEYGQGQAQQTGAYPVMSMVDGTTGYSDGTKRDASGNVVGYWK